MAGDQDTSFAKLVSLAAHDLRTPLATVFGFARTLARDDSLPPTPMQYIGMIESASIQLRDLLDELALAARIESGRYEPVRADVDTLEIARAAAEALGEERVEVAGGGGSISVDGHVTEIAVSALTQCALRHGGLERVRVTADGAGWTIDPITPASAPVVLGEDLRDLGAAVAVRAIAAQGGSISLDGETLRVALA
jgi:signal transduction histidine kinase